MRTFTKIIGFIILVGLILALMQVFSTATRHQAVTLGPGVKFAPRPEVASEPAAPAEKPEPMAAKKAEIKELPASPEPLAQKPAPPQELENAQAPPPPAPLPQEKSLEVTPAPESTPEKTQVAAADDPPPEAAAKPETEAPGVTDETPKTLSGVSEHTPAQKRTQPDEILLADEAFMALDQLQETERQNAASASKDVQGRYGWGLVDDYQTPDQAVRALGGTPFAIDEKQKRYFRIDTDKAEVRPLMMLAGYGGTGVEARDPQLRRIVRQAGRQGRLDEPADTLAFYYLFSQNTEAYVTAKVVRAFEWQIQKMNLDKDAAETFRGQAKLRLDVKKALRENGGTLGVVVPLYFEFEKQKTALSKAFYAQDPEIAQLGISIEPGRYL